MEPVNLHCSKLLPSIKTFYWFGVYKWASFGSLELGAGFNMEYTGLENVYINGRMTGFSKKEVDEKLKDILEFADIGDFIYQPVKTYSSGMFVRLAFAVAINIEPEF